MEQNGRVQIKRAKAIFAKKQPGVKLATMAEFISLKNRTSIFDNLENYDEVTNKFETLKWPGKRWFLGVGPIFMLDIGEGLTEYRT